MVRAAFPEVRHHGRLARRGRRGSPTARASAAPGRSVRWRRVKRNRSAAAPKNLGALSTSEGHQKQRHVKGLIGDD